MSKSFVMVCPGDFCQEDQEAKLGRVLFFFFAFFSFPKCRGLVQTQVRKLGFHVLAGAGHWPRAHTRTHNPGPSPFLPHRQRSATGAGYGKQVIPEPGQPKEMWDLGGALV